MIPKGLFEIRVGDSSAKGIAKFSNNGGKGRTKGYERSLMIYKRMATFPLLLLPSSISTQWQNKRAI